MEPTETMRTIVDQYEDYNYKVSLSLTSYMLCIDQEFLGNMIGIFFFYQFLYLNINDCCHSINNRTRVHR